MARAWKPSISNLFLAILTTAVSFGDAQSTSKCYFNASLPSPVPSTLSGYSQAYTEISIGNTELSTAPCLSSYCFSSQLAGWSTWEFGPRTTSYSTESYLYGSETITTTFTYIGGSGGSNYYSFPYTAPCCGQCTVDIDSIFSIGYWPTPAISSAATTVVDDQGVTYTSPTPYVVLAGIDAYDKCTQIGTLQARPTTIPINPLGFYSLLLPLNGESGDNFTFPVQVDFRDFNNCEGVTFGGENFTTKTISGTTFVGERCLPSISLPTEITSLQPVFAAKKCVGGEHNVHDPPVALTPGQVLAPPTSTPAPSSSPSALPVSTEGPTKTDPPAAPIASVGSTPILDPSSPASSPADPNDPAGDDPSTSALPPSASAAPIALSIQASFADPSTSSLTPTPPIVTPALVAFSEQASLSPPASTPLASSPPALSLPVPPPSAFTVGSQTFTALPSAIVADTVTLTPGGPAATISGTLVSLGLSAFVVGDKTETFAPLVTAPPPATLPATSIFTVGGETFTALPGVVVGAGTTLTAGASSQVVVDGTTVQVGSGYVVVGGSTVALPAAGQASGGIDPSASGSGIDIGGVILSGIGGVGGGVVTASTGAGGNSSVLQPFSGSANGRSVQTGMMWTMFAGVLVAGLA